MNTEQELDLLRVIYIVAPILTLAAGAFSLWLFWRLVKAHEKLADAQRFLSIRTEIAQKPPEAHKEATR